MIFCSIESEPDQDYLLKNVLLKRYSIFTEGEETAPANVIERSVDLHALRVISSAGYQKCIQYLWRGWICQEEGNPTNFVEYKNKSSTDYWVHFHPDRIRTPLYQNICQILFSLIYLILYTAVINTVNPTGDLDTVECILYLMTLAFICDEAAKFWKVGRNYLEFWNAFNSTLYTLLAISFIMRVVAPFADLSLEAYDKRVVILHAAGRVRIVHKDVPPHSFLSPSRKILFE